MRPSKSGSLLQLFYHQHKLKQQMFIQHPLRQRPALKIMVWSQACHMAYILLSVVTIKCLCFIDFIEHSYISLDTMCCSKHIAKLTHLILTITWRCSYIHFMAEYTQRTQWLSELPEITHLIRGRARNRTGQLTTVCVFTFHALWTLQIGEFLS